MAGFFKKLINKITNTAEIDWDDLEAELITGDLGVKLSLEIVSELQDLGRKVSADDVVETTRTKLSALFPTGDPDPDNYGVVLRQHGPKKKTTWQFLGVS